MITEIVLSHLPDGMSREAAITKYRLSAPGSRAKRANAREACARTKVRDLRQLPSSARHCLSWH
jgi:hypothetical protein